MNRRVLIGLVLALVGVLMGTLGARFSLVWFLLSLAILVFAAFLLLDTLMHAGDEKLPKDLQTEESQPIIGPSFNQSLNPETVQADHNFARRGIP
jgi:hypothetical protein